MNLRNLWSSATHPSNGLLGTLAVLDAPELEAKVFQESDKIEQFCSALIKTKANLYTHSVGDDVGIDGDFDSATQTIVMVGMSDNEVVLELSSTAAQAMTAQTPQPQKNAINLTTSAPGGAALFTLPNFRKTSSRFARASRPALVIQTQSREHFRVPCKRGARQLAHLLLEGSAQPLALRDLSETGLSFVHNQVLPSNPQSNVQTVQAVLVLEDARLTIPKLTIVRSTTLDPAHWHYGAAIQGLPESDLCTIRRWIHHMETSPVAMRLN